MKIHALCLVKNEADVLQELLYRPCIGVITSMCLIMVATTEVGNWLRRLPSSIYRLYLTSRMISYTPMDFEQIFSTHFNRKLALKTGGARWTPMNSI